MISFIKVAILFIINKGRLNENKKNVESHCIWTKRVNPQVESVRPTAAMNTAPYAN